MTRARRTTVRLDAEVHRALRDRAAATGRTMSDVVVAAVRRRFAEDADDLAAIEARADEPTRPFADVVAGLDRGGTRRGR